MKKALHKKFSCSTEYMDSLIAAIDVNRITASAESSVQIQIIEPPTVNGVDLRNHPNEYQRKRYTQHLKNGGKIAGIYDGGALYGISLMNSEDAKKNLNHSELKKSIVDSKVFSTIASRIENNFERGNRGRRVPKNAKSSDIWYLFTDEERNDIISSTDADVSAIVIAVASSITIKATSAKFKEYLDTLMLKGLISKRTYNDLKGKK